MNLWGRLGISVAIVAMFCIVMTEFLQHTAYYESYRWHMCGIFVAAGISMGLIGRRLNDRWRKAHQLLGKRDEFSDATEEEQLPTDPFLLVNVAYWGLMLIVLGVTTRRDLGRLEVALRSLDRDGAVWVVWPKGRRELTEDHIRAAALEAGLVDVKVMAFSTALSALMLVIPVAKR